MKKILGLTLIALVAIPALALAAAKPGSYAGTSSGTVNVYGGGSKVDKGKVTFTVKNNKVSKFQVKGQEMQCNAGAAEIPISAPTFKLNSKGKGSVTYEEKNVGNLKITITVTSRGTASGTIAKPANKPGLCMSSAKFSAKKK